MSSLNRVQPLLAQVPIAEDIVDVVVNDTLGWGFEKVAQGIAAWVLDAVGFFVQGIVDFLLTSARPDVTAAWFAGPGSPFATVRNVGAATLLGFVFLGLLQGLLAGDLGGMSRRIALDLPAAVVGMIAITIVVDRLLALTDALSAAVLANSDSQAVHFLSGFGVAVSGLTHGFAAVLLGLVAILAGLLVWVELMVRSVLVYVLVALSPLSFATAVWPAARGVVRRTVEVLLAVIFSKLVIAIAISVGVAALSGAGSASPPEASLTDEVATGMGTLFVGTAVLAMAAFSPFLLLKLIPIAEAALVAQGVSRSPVRGAQATMSNVYYAQSLSRLAGGGGQPQLVSGSSAGAQQAGAWAVGPNTTAPPSAGAGGAFPTGAAPGGPAGAATTGGTAVLGAGARAASRATEGLAEAGGRAGEPPRSRQRPHPEPGSDQR